MIISVPIMVILLIGLWEIVLTLVLKTFGPWKSAEGSWPYCGVKRKGAIEYFTFYFLLNRYFRKYLASISRSMSKQEF